MFEISGEDVAGLGDADLRTLVSKLARAELRTQGCPVSSVTAGGDQDAADGGIDVRVECPCVPARPDFVPRRLTGFQVKKPDMPTRAIWNEMRPNGVLREAIRALADQSGSYVIVSAQGSVADRPLADRRKAMQDAIHDHPNAAQFHTDFYDRDRVAAWIDEYPGVAAWVRSRIGRPLSGWSGIGDLDGLEDNARGAYLLSDKACLIDERSREREHLTIAEGIARLRGLLRTPQQCVRLVGLSGLGKTRLIQALFEQGIGDDPLDPGVAVYTDFSEETNPSARDMARNLVTRGERAVLIVDNCNPSTHSKLARLCAADASRVSLITVEYDLRDDEPEHTQVFRLHPVSPELVVEWLKRISPNISQVDREKIAEFSDANFRVARALAETVGQGETLGRVRSRELFDRIFQQRNVPDQGLLRAAEDLSLLYSIDGEDTSPEGELGRVGAIGEISARQLYEALAEMKRRGVVQARGRFRAILPQAIANRLAAHALERIPPADFDRFCVTLTDRMLASVSRRLGFLHDSAEAQAVVERWLRADGPLGDLFAASSRHAFRVVTNIAPVAPKAVLLKLKRELEGERGHRHPLVGASDRFQWIRLIKALGYDADLFSAALMLLARFISGEPEGNNTNSARHSFEGFFHLYLSGTHATPEQRRTAVKELALSDDQELHRCASLALEALLQTDGFWSIGDVDFGARSRDWGWQPKIRKDTWDWCNGAIALAVELEPRLPDAGAIVARHVRGLWHFEACHGAIERAAEVFGRKQPWIEGWLALRAALRFDGAKMSEGFRGRLERLIERLSPSDLLSQARAAILNRMFGGWDIADGEDDDDTTRSWAKAAEIAREIGQSLAGDIDVRRRFIPELLSEPRALRAFECGRGLAEGASALHTFWCELVAMYGSAPANARNPTVLCGFLCEANRLDERFARSALEAAIDESALVPILPRLQASVGIDADGISRLRRAIARGVLPAASFYDLANGHVSGSPPRPLAELLEDIAALPNGVVVALEILHMHLFRSRNETSERDPRVLEVGRGLLVAIDFCELAGLQDFSTESVVRVCLAGEDGRGAAQQVCANARGALESLRASLYQLPGTLRALFETQPFVALDSFLLADRTSPSHRLFKPWRHEETPIESLDSAILQEWADRDAGVRYPLLGQSLRMFVRHLGDEGNEMSPLFLSILEHASDKRVFLGEIGRQAHPTSWSGSLAEILIRRRASIAKLADHPDAEVRAWICESLPELDGWIERERSRERQGEQSFE